MKALSKMLSAELLGTFLLVFAGTGAMVVNDLTGVIGHAGVAISWGLSVTILVYTFGHVSGAHINPAVTLGLWLHGKCERRIVVPYIVAQILGAIAASWSIKALFPTHLALGGTVPLYSDVHALVIEFILTFLLMYVVLSMISKEQSAPSLAGIVIGATVGLEAMFAGPITGASMNPARSLGPALVSGQMDHLWVYVVGTIAGALCAVIVHRVIK